MTYSILEKMGVVAAVILPLFNIPLITKIVQRRSSKDISLSWALGVWICFLFMLPSGLNTEDIVWKIFNIANITMFSVVVFFTVKYRKGDLGDR